MTEKEFISNMKHVTGNRVHKFTNSYGTRDYFYYYKTKSKRFNESEFRIVLKAIFKAAAEELLSGREFVLPKNLGVLKVLKFTRKLRIQDGKLVTNLPIDWNATFKLWYSDESSMKKKRLVRCDTGDVFRVFYDKKHAIFNNKRFFEFKTSRTLKLALKDAIVNNKIDALLID